MYALSADTMFRKRDIRLHQNFIIRFPKVTQKMPLSCLTNESGHCQTSYTPKSCQFPVFRKSIKELQPSRQPIIVMLCCDHHNGYLVCTTRQTRNHPIPDYNRTLQAYPGGRQHYTEVWERNAEAENSMSYGMHI